jgi:hypothetical protein
MMQRLELVKLPSSSTKEVTGSMKTSVSIEAVSTSLNSPWFSQKRTVSVSIGSMLTRNFSLESAATFFSLWAIDISGLKPWQSRPVVLPWCMTSNIRKQS